MSKDTEKEVLRLQKILQYHCHEVCVEYGDPNSTGEYCNEMCELFEFKDLDLDKE